MRHYRPYTAYRNSGVEWLGEVPKHWEVFPLFAVASERNASNKGMLEDNLLSLSYGAIIRKDINTNDGLLPESFETYQIVEPGDMIFRLTDLQNDKRSLRTAIVKETGIITSAYIAVSPKSVEPKYFNYLLRAYDVQKVFYSMGGGMRQSMKFDDLRRMAVLRPSIDEQITICAMLDRETLRMDGLVSKKTCFIELLREKRQALITHAVTKGLDPNVKMKDSGVEWLGKVPVHWGILPIKHIVATPITDGPHETPDFVDEGIPFVSAEAISSGQINFEKIRGYITEEAHRQYSEKYHPQRGDIFMIKSGATTGITAMVETDIDFNIWSPLAVIRCGARSDPRFVLSYMRSRSFQDAIELNWNYGTQQNIGMGVIGDLAITVPPIEEQMEIASRIDSQTTRLDTLINKTERSVELLKERRSALITAAVTGQIDLREAA